ncbi:NAD(P) transhydrogenase subunit alpha [Halolactibacillus alkaliphilus]|uniref:proton-translocating NAD(P)(+) transhydrogenase n=1 Tax=Halolactibacillus alkaliphilus TaxID=442899 RepID=A0A511WZ62_9BACI|nr:NAD(P) transhydrogenase subunit alpha [Halolactibacillus alkaliphilus]GEN55552.1 NAD(P) transhydrogenase subunit alpha [Halolactibacillus alkaliphilus]GGN64061.1 NAD(P) transhydrogenase subunit alpha [Halolactibacillus alkaliphilus]SFO61905.1 NAD(P) transhydrogenase subunit alpha [Halolactibacillus alkaliphilus]
MKIVALKESNEPRVALVPDAVKKLCQLEGIEVAVECQLSSMMTDEAFEAAGAQLEEKREHLLASGDIFLSVNAPLIEDIKQMKRGSLCISFLDPYNDKERIKTFVAQGVNAISMEMLPRTTLAQKMDAISSQASLAGYVAVVLGANKLDRIFPMMMTPSGTIPPAKVFVIGAGVAGLQAIATAKRLGARVEAFDTRPVVEEQVTSLGAKFVKVDLGETGQNKDGYANALTEEQLKIQQQAMAKSCANADLVITTAKLFGRKAPVIVTKDILKQMRNGAVIIDLAAGCGGNVEGTVIDETVTVEGVDIVGMDNLPGEVAFDASSMYASNLYHLISHFYNKETQNISLDQSDEIMNGCLVTKDGQVVNERLTEIYGG